MPRGERVEGIVPWIGISISKEVQLNLNNQQLQTKQSVFNNLFKIFLKSYFFSTKIFVNFLQSTSPHIHCR